MSRPSDWYVLDLDGDPTPGDPRNLESLATRFLDFADVAERSYRQVTSMAGDSAVMSWVGQSGDAFRDQFGGFPDQLRKLYVSHEMCGEALTRFGPVLEQAQSQADRALADGREARAQLTSAVSALTVAKDDAGAASKNANKLENPAKDAPEPDKEQVAQAVRDAQVAQQRQSDAEGAVGAAQSALDAAKNLAEQARQLRDGAAKEAVRGINEASDAGIKPRNFWQKLADFFKGLWEIICKIAEVLAIVFGVLAIIFGGPFAWIALIAGAVLLVKAIVDFASGKGNIMDLVFGLLGVIPGIKGLTTIGKVSTLFKQGGFKAIGKAALTGAKDILKNLVNGIRNLGPGLANLVKKGLGGTIGKINSIPKFTSKDIKSIPACGDPVDVATGRMFIPQNDLRLPGRLPLDLGRTHLSDHRTGRAFGPSWASWLDQRLLVQPDAVHLVAADGMMLTYPLPEESGAVLPVHGMAAPLRRTAEGFVLENPDGAVSLLFGPADEEGEAGLRAVADPHGNRIEVDRDEFDQIVLIRHSGGYRVGVEHNAAGLVSALRMLPRADAPADAEGVRPVLLRTFEYDENRRLTGVVDAQGRPQRYQYDAEGRIVQWLDRNGVWFRYEYDAEGRCVRTEGRDGYLSYRYHYDVKAGVTKVADSLGHVTTFTLNDDLQLVAETDPLGGTVWTEWDPRHNVVSQTDQLGATVRLVRNAHDDVVAVVDADGRRMTATYAAPGKVAAVTGPDGAVWRREYDDTGRIVGESDPTGLAFHYEHETDAAPAGTGGLSESVEWDAAGLPVLVTNAEGKWLRLGRDRFGRVTELTDEQGNRTTYAYTPDGDVAETVDPTGRTQSWVHDGEGNIVAYSDGAGRTSTIGYTGFNLPAEVVEGDGASTRYRYDTELRLVEVINPEGRSWHYEYDAAGRQVAETDFDGRRTEYAYDAVGRLVRRVEPAGDVTEFAFDERGNLILRRTADGDTRYRYDAWDRLVHTTGRHAEVVLERDELGRVVAETVNGRTVRTSFDALGRISGRLTPAGGPAVWQYDVVGRPVLLHTAEHQVHLGYDELGRESFRQLDGRAFLSREVDAAGRSLGHTLLAGDLAGAPEALRPVHWQRIGYGADGDPVQIRDEKAERTLDLDAAGRIVAVRSDSGVVSESYAYNGSGDLVSADWAGAGAAAGTREYSGTRLVRAGNTRYEYDEAGRTVVRERPAGEAQRYTWNAEGRLVGLVTSDGQRWRYTYDPFGRRIAKDRLEPVGQKDRVVERTEYIWSGDVLVEEIRTDRAGMSDTRTWHRLGDDFDTVAQYEQHADRNIVLDQTLTMVVTDVVGAPSALIGTDGELRWRREGTIWGQDSESTQRGMPLRMPGQYLDPETGLHYNHQRYYDPQTGRYLSPDPLGLAASPNPVAYVPNPLTAYDPLGLVCKAPSKAQPKPHKKKPYDRDWSKLENPKPGQQPKPAPTGEASNSKITDPSYGGLFGEPGKYKGNGYSSAVGEHRHTNEFSAWGIRESEHVMPMKALENGGVRGPSRDGEANEIAYSIPYGAHRAGQNGAGFGITSTGRSDTASKWATRLGDMLRSGDNYGAYRNAVLDQLNVDPRSAEGLVHYLDKVQSGVGLRAGEAPRLTPAEVADLKNLALNRYFDSLPRT